MLLPSLCWFLLLELTYPQPLLPSPSNTGIHWKHLAQYQGTEICVPYPQLLPAINLSPPRFLVPLSCFYYPSAEARNCSFILSPHLLHHQSDLVTPSLHKLPDPDNALLLLHTRDCSMLGADTDALLCRPGTLTCSSYIMSQSDPSDFIYNEVYSVW